MLRLDANESCFAPPPSLCSKISKINSHMLRCYPDPYCTRLRLKLSRTFSIGKDEIAVGNGSIELLSLCFKLFAEGKTILLPDPSYKDYESLAKLYNINTKSTPLVETKARYNYDIGDILAKSDDADAIVLCSPNNPAGNTIDQKDIIHLAKRYKGIIVLDEAYSQPFDKHNLDLPKKYSNLIVTRSFSKYLGLAGIRIGFAVANKKIASIMRGIISLNAPSGLSQELAIAALDARSYYKKLALEITRNRIRLNKGLFFLGLKPYRSDANFIFVKTHHAKEICEHLAKKGIAVRFIPRENGFRITIGTKSQMATVVKEINKLVVK